MGELAHATTPDLDTALPDSTHDTDADVPAPALAALSVADDHHVVGKAPPAVTGPGTGQDTSTFISCDAGAGANGAASMMTSDTEPRSDAAASTAAATALAERNSLTDALASSPYDLNLYLARARAHAALGYPDLGASDAYRALLLADEAATDGFEYHRQARAALRTHTEVPRVLVGVEPPESLLDNDAGGDDDDHEEEDGDEHEGGEEEAFASAPIGALASALAAAGALCAYHLLTTYLLDLGCLASTATYLRRGLDVAPTDATLLGIKTRLEAAAAERFGHPVPDILTADLPDTVLVRREVYPWNTYEPDRNGPASLATLNATLRTLAPKCAVQVAELPVLDLDGVAVDGEMNYQLGVFATEDIAPGEVVLSEYSLLTANNRLKDMVCEACSSELPRDRDGVVNCPECYDATFCSQWCLDRANERYHPSVCGTDVDEIAKDPEAAEADESLHLLLLARVLAIAEHEDIHPLDVAEVKFIWGDFTPFPSLPFSFKYNVETPLHILETMDVDIYASPQYDTWVLNTLYAKSRGTASARKNPRDGRPDVAAVHTYWCLANHDCDPNVSWDWAGRMVLRAREARIANEPGIRKGEEILNHYCDVTLPVQERREWAKGPLGGWSARQPGGVRACSELNPPNGQCNSTILFMHD